MRPRTSSLPTPARRAAARAGLALAFAATAPLALAVKPVRAQQKSPKLPAKKIETPQKYILQLGEAEVKARQIALKPSAPRLAQTPKSPAPDKSAPAAPTPNSSVEPVTPSSTSAPAVPAPISPSLVPPPIEAPATGAPSGDDGAPIIPPPAPVTAPQVPAPAAPPRDLPIENPPTQPNTRIENPNVVLPPAPLAGVTLLPDANVATGPNGGPVGSDAGIEGGAPTPALPPDLTTIPSSSDTDIASGQEDPNGQFAIEAPGGLIYDRERNLALAQGEVKFTYRDFSVTGEQGVIDYNTNRATLAGNLEVSARGQSFQGQSLTFDLDTGRWLLSSVAKTFPPELFPPGTVLEPLYIRDGRVLGQGDTGIGENFKFSSCDRDHYYLRSNRIEFYRDPNSQPKRLVLRKNALYVFRKKILPLPVYVIGLVAGAGSRRSPVNATVGQNAVDGYFVRSFYDISATNNYTNSVLVDALQKRGLGLGLQQLDAAGGLLYGYVLSSQTGGRETNFRVLKNRKITGLVNLNARLEATSNNSLTGPGVSARNGDFTFARQGTNAQTNAIFRFNNSNYNGGSNASGSVSLDHIQTFGRGYSLTASGQLNQSKSAFGVGTAASTNDAATGDLNLQLAKKAANFDAILRTELHPDINNNRVNQLERLPELLFQTDSRRLPIPGISQFLPGNFTLGLGQFNEPRAIAGTDGQTNFSGLKKNRADLFYNFDQRNVRLLGNGRSSSIFRASGNFDQAVYSDSFSRYNYGYNFNLINTLGNLTLQANYFNARTFGATPFQFDFVTPSENIDYTASYNLGQKLRLNLSGGSDLMNSYQRDLIFNAQFAPTPSFYGSLGTSYALENSDFGEIYGNFNVARNRRKFGGGALAFGFRYDPGGRGLTRANLSADVNLGAKTRVQGLTSYSGFSQKFEFTQIRVIQDLHCFNLYLNYDNQRNQIRVDVALKAFPFADTRFGRNVLSEGFDSSVGTAR